MFQSLADVILNDLAPSKEKSAPSSISLPALHPSSLVEDQAQPAFATRKVTSPPDDGISIFVAIGAKMEKRVGVATSNWSPSRSIAISRDTRSVRSEEHTSELQSLMRISYAVFCLKKK